jgi:8-oxo-dGTP pyrophosphatase MutT (NUDIX family)
LPWRRRKICESSRDRSPLTDASMLTGRAFFERVRARLDLVVPPGLADAAVTPARGDYDLDPMLRAVAEVRPIRPAAVLVPIVDRAEPTVLLTQRTADLPDHAGQIAFPGGKIDPSDATPLAAAVREAREEIGLEARFIEPLGYLDLYMTTLGYRIVPTVARVVPDFTLTLSPREVADAFEVPLAFLMEPVNHQQHRREWKGLQRTFYAMPYGDRYIWGATAGILRNLYERICRE